jgi:hypothetical protein
MKRLAFVIFVGVMLAGCEQTPKPDPERGEKPAGFGRLEEARRPVADSRDMRPAGESAEPRTYESSMTIFDTSKK